MEFLRQLLRGIGQAWQRLSASAKVNIALAALATVILVGLVVFIAGRPQMVRLYSGLELDDAANIESFLRDQGVAYRLTDGGTTVMVPVQERTRLRVALSDQGLPKTQGVAPGFELFERQELMSNRWLQDVNYMRAVQGALQRQLNEFDFVNKSFVFIREAEEELFISEQKPSEAAVTLDVTRPLTPREVKGILGTVSSFGGANLHPGNITLTTTDGTALHLPPSDEFASIANSKIEYIHDLETQRERRAEEALAKAGINAVVRVSADVDFDTVKETTNKTSEGTVVSTWTSSSTTTSNEALPGGAPGAVANLPEGMGGPGAVRTESVTEDTIDNYQPTTTVTERSTTPGTIKGYRVSAFVEGQRTPVLDAEGNETGEFEYQALSSEQLGKYRDMIAAAVGVGVNAASITVHDHPFKIDRLAAVRDTFEAIEAAKTRDIVLEWAGWAARALAIVAGFLLVRWFLRRAMVLPPEEEGEVVEIPAATAEDLRRREVATEVERMSHEEPEVVAALLRSWLSEKE